MGALPRGLGVGRARDDGQRVGVDVDGVFTLPRSRWTYRENSAPWFGYRRWPKGALGHLGADREGGVQAQILAGDERRVLRVQGGARRKKSQRKSRSLQVVTKDAAVEVRVRRADDAGDAKVFLERDER